MEVKAYERKLECPSCDTAIVVHHDKLYPTGKLHCFDCGEELQDTGL